MFRKGLVGFGCIAIIMSAAGCFSGFGMGSYNARLKAQQDTVNPLPDTVKRPGHFPEATALIHDAFESQSRSVSPSPSFIRGFAKADDWEMERNPRGTITGREVDAVIFYKGGQSGWCRMEHVKLYEENQGGQHWGKPTLYTMGVYGKQGILTMGFHVDCNEIGTLPPDPA